MTASAADANRLNLAYWEETTYGVAPTANPTLVNLRLTSESLKQQTSSILSNELRSDRQRSDMIRTGVEALGNVGIELSYDPTHRQFMQYGLLSSAFSSEVTVTETTISFAAASGGIQNIADSGSGFGSITVGSWVRVSGDTNNTVNNGLFKVVAVDGGGADIDVVNPDGVVQAAGDSITVTQLAQAVNGTTLNTIFLEKEFTDLSNEFAYYTGCAVNQWSVSAALQSIISGSFDFIGNKEVSNTATLGDGSNTAASADQILNTIDHIKHIDHAYGASSASWLNVTQFDFSVNNNLRNRMQLGQVGPCGIGVGSIEVTGSMTKYFESKTIMDRYLNWTDTNMAVAMQDTAGNSYIFDFPQVKLTDGQRVAGGIDTDIMAEIQWTAYLDPTENITMRVAIDAA